MIIWKQGQFYPELGKKIVELPNNINPGPSDKLIRIDGFDVEPDENGDFILGVNGKPYTEDELDAINTYAVIRMIINLYEDLLKKPIQWSWWEDGKGEPLLVKIRNNDINARFIKEYKCIELDYYGPYNKWTYNCRTIDLIAHETGHVILDSISPHLNEGSVETMGIGEAFCDLSAMFWILSQKDLCEFIIKETNGDLAKNSILTLFGVCNDNGKLEPVRSAINDMEYLSSYLFPYDYSQILVGIAYELLVELYKINKDREVSRALNLYNSGQFWMHKIFNTYLNHYPGNSGVKEFAEILIRDFELDSVKIKRALW